MDPARRDTNGQRTYAIADCTPDVTSCIDDLLRQTQVVMIKLSPMLDWHSAMRELNDAAQSHDAVREIHIVSVGNECKELLDKPVDFVLLNGCDNSVWTKAAAVTKTRKGARKRLLNVAKA